MKQQHQQLPLIDLTIHNQQQDKDPENFPDYIPTNKVRLSKKKFSSNVLPDLKTYLNSKNINYPNYSNNNIYIEAENNIFSPEMSTKKREYLNINKKDRVKNIIDFKLNSANQEVEVHKSSKENYKDYKLLNSNEERGEMLKKTNNKNNSVKQSLTAISKIEDIKKKNAELKRKEEIERKKTSYKIKKKLEMIVDHNLFVIFFMVLTVFVMFIGDIQNGWLTSDVDYPIDLIQLIVMSLFSLEIILNCFAKEGYTNSFFFWLDVVSTLSLITDIGILFDPLLNLGSTTTIE